MNSVRGVTGHKIETFSGTDQVIAQAIKDAKTANLCKNGSKIAVIYGSNEDTPDESNIMKILDAWVNMASVSIDKFWKK